MLLATISKKKTFRLFLSARTNCQSETTGTLIIKSTSPVSINRFPVCPFFFFLFFLVNPPAISTCSLSNRTYDPHVFPIPSVGEGRGRES